ncbi:DNA/RNA non-specific endonuclease [Streptosporangium sp. NBC_01755]|uniref:DNA/RNA non-specific endonuclease n=1 Tax=Streptosporangium sp. NBC_01755 TaxID=2975949 RepID=UPI002DDB98A3|nr:DNA/RNA non-specific endonuclease [Streptosporangium sp. NBC_01755]WSD00608.1 DNA/RNA non-specific endonuclease [Streptosporangium sp. NBC_01755]
MDSVEGPPAGLQEDVAARVADRSEQRRRKIAVLAEPGGIARADEPVRVAARIDRLSRHYRDIRPIDPTAITAAQPAAVTAAAAVLERIIQTNDLLPVGYLEGGATAARAVGRVVVRDARGRLAGYGTGSLVSPDLLLTNQHVLADARTAGRSGVEFDYQDGLDGRPLPLQGFSLDPGRFFFADQELDFALVAVKAGTGELARFGFNRLVASEGKAIVGDFVTIIQHPGGEKKQVALRENRIVDILELFLHYQTDTEPGSSGSPVFNDQWEIVALHHAGIPAPDHDAFGGVINEGVRVSRLLAFLRGQPFPPAQQALVDRLFTERISLPPAPPTVTALTDRSLTRAIEPAEPVGRPAAGQVPLTLTLTVPFDIRLRGEPAAADGPAAAAPEAIRIDPDYAGRRGYDPDFLPGGPRVPLPALPPDLVALAALNRHAGDGQADGQAHVLNYHHFSVVMNRQRRLAFFTAVNIDGATSLRIRRDPDRWIFDPRLPDSEQAGEEVYRDNPLDRGHLVRRLDPAWGASNVVAKSGNDDTFHFTNCTPQHKDFNQNQTTWAGLEDYILDNADTRDLKATVFTGPVLAADDDPYRGVQLPRQYWKVVAMIKQNGELSATGYLLSQDHLIDGLETAPAEFSYGAYKTYQVPIQRIEDLTRLSFDTLADADPLARMEAAATTAREITHPRQLTL